MSICVIELFLFFAFYPRDAMLARVIAIATCLSVCLSVRLSRAGIGHWSLVYLLYL